MLQARSLRHAVSALVQLRTCSLKGLAGFVAFVFLEVLDEAAGEVLGLLFPLCGIGIGVAGIEDGGIYAGQGSGHFEVEERNLLGRSALDGSVENGVDDATGVLNRDALACSVPTGVDKIGLGSALLHLLYEFLGILCGMELEECLSEAG